MKPKILNFVEAMILYQKLKEKNLLWLFSDTSLDIKTFIFLFFDELEEEDILVILGILFGENFINTNSENFEELLIGSFRENKITGLINHLNEMK